MHFPVYGNKTRDKIYQRISKAAGVVARNLMPADHMFDRHEPVENWPSYMRPERLDEEMPFVMDVGERRPRFDYREKPNRPCAPDSALKRSISLPNLLKIRRCSFLHSRTS